MDVSRVHSVRLPGFVVTRESVYRRRGGAAGCSATDPGERPQPYVAGSLLAIRRVAEAPGLRRGPD